VRNLDDIALPESKVGPLTNSVPERVWMRLWRSLSDELNAICRHIEGEPVEIEEVEFLSPVASELGERGMEEIAAFVRGVLAPLLEDARKRDAEDYSFQALVGWHLALNPSSLDREAQLREEFPAVYEVLARQDRGVGRALNQRMWRHAAPTQLQAGAAPGLRAFVGALVDALETVRQERIRVPDVPAAQAETALQGLLSPTLLTKMGAGRPTVVQRRAYPRIREVVAERQSMLVLGPPGCGKSWVGQVVAAHAVESGRRAGGEMHALVLVPTRAMVRESFLRWQQWTAAEEPRWRIVAGSADDREFDEAFAEGDFDVAIAVYEKLASLVFSQREVLDRVGVIVVDELQNVGHQQKGLNLEALLTVLRLHWPHIPIVGLSATISGRSVRKVCEWLDMKHLIETHARSTDLRVHLFDGVQEREALLPAAPDVVDGGEEDLAAPEPIDRGSRSHQLSRPDSWKGRPLVSRANQLHVKAPLLQTLSLLDRAEELDKRILCFVRDRDRAAEVARLLREALALRDPRQPAPPPRNPWIHGRYATNLPPEEASDAYRRLLNLDANRWREDAQEGLLAGIGYHTGALQTELRQMLEEEFKGGLLRVLVCTETLAEGVNLPASDSVLFDLTRFEPRAEGQVPITIGDFRNRAGRAGRLGTRVKRSGEEGNAWVFVDALFDPKRLADRVDELVVRDMEGAWRHWILGAIRDETLNSALGDDARGHANLCGVVLRILAVHKYRYSREDMLARIEEIMAATYWAAWGNQADTEEILEELEEREFMETISQRQRVEEVLETLTATGLVAEDEEERLQITRLGVAIARSSLPLESSLRIKNIALNSAQMGTISLFVEACQDPSVTGTLGNKWLGWKVDERLPRAHRDDVMTAVHAFARLYASPDEQVRRLYAEKFWKTVVPTASGPPREVLPDEDLVARSPEPLEPELRRWILSDPPPDQQHAGIITPERTYATAVLRSILAYEWSSFIPWEDMYARLQLITVAAGRDHEQRRAAIDGSPADVLQLAERVAHLLASASEFVEGDPKERQRLRQLAEQLKSGVPHWLLPLWKLRERGLSREVILRFHKTDRAPTEDLERVLTGWSEVKLDSEVRDAALAAYRAQRESQEDRYQRVPRRLEGREIRSERGRPYSTVFVEFMTIGDPLPLSEYTEGLLREHAIGMEVTVADGLVLATGELEGEPVELCFLPEAATLDGLAKLTAGSPRRVLVPMRKPGWMVEAALDELDPASASAVSPHALFVLLAELRDRHPQSSDLTQPFLSSLTKAAGFSRHGHELAELAILPESAIETEPPPGDRVDLLKALLEESRFDSTGAAEADF
jgi:replicative superfamily II helicase